MSDNSTSTNAEDPSIDNLWGDALNEQQTSTHAMAPEVEDLSLIMDIPVKMSVELGRTKMTIKELLRLSQGSVVALDGLAGEPLDILINGYLIAQGEVVVVSDKFGIRITEIITPSERMHRLSR
ncbi:flagellar motor switch protein FliN [Pantoea sp. Acro-805]|jgi:flagellar motor switch protein FliN|uniref:Flagellar motor switch protein FliN n=1 Tax=Candidatus Pantoea formicae TaxID=2608355 RepID=A0ABX0QVZ8_9GAMM|nr:flagellar motor switch protein FliN [Pantoea formicae]MDF7647161.1 flagellar motor switch protein FliN [Erwiniaceae bacterium L1_54_3]NIF01202.1 flagellar motor switch protein FliN [Pantoea formicae]